MSRVERSLHVERHEPDAASSGPSPTVVLVHGSLDRGASFRRVQRRLPEMVIVTYDRRGYQRSRLAGPTDVAGHVDDLVEVVDQQSTPGAPVVVVGHSFGGVVALGAAATAPGTIDAVGAYEPPLPWLGFRRPDLEALRPSATAATAGTGGATDDDAGGEAERFFRRMVGDGAWDRLSEEQRASRRADGPTLVQELRSLRQGPGWEITTIDVPVVIGRGGPRSLPHHRRGTAWLVEHLPDAALEELDSAGHGAHLSHPDAFARMVRRVVDRLGDRRPPTPEQLRHVDGPSERTMTTER